MCMLKGHVSEANLRCLGSRLNWCSPAKQPRRPAVMAVSNGTLLCRAIGTLSAGKKVRFQDRRTNFTAPSVNVFKASLG